MIPMSNHLQQLRVIEPPDTEWLTRLRRGHLAWAVKEHRFVHIEFAYEPPEPGYRAGRIGLRFCWEDSDKWGIEPACFPWFIDTDGRGLDGKRLLLPVNGHCPDEAPPISEPWLRHVERTLGQLAHRIEQLETQLKRESTDPWRDYP